MQRTMPLAAKPPPQRTRFYGWTVAATLWLTLLITTGLPYYGASVVIANMAKSIAIDKATIGIAFSLLTVVWGLSGPFTAALLNRKGLRFTVVLGTLVIAIGCALIALLVQNAWTFVVLFGLVIGAGFRLAVAFRKHPLGPMVCWVFAAITFAAMALWRFPLGWVLPVVGGTACVLTWFKLGRDTAQAAKS